MKKKNKINPDSLRICNCSECGVMLFGESHSKQEIEDLKDAAHKLGYYISSRVAGRIRSRPLCPNCIRCHLPTTIGSAGGTLDDISPWQENAIRAMEGD